MKNLVPLSFAYPELSCSWQSNWMGTIALVGPEGQAATPSLGLLETQ